MVADIDVLQKAENYPSDEDCDWSASITLDRHLLDAVFSLEFLAQALGYAAVRAGHTVRCVHADGLFKAMSQARVDNSAGQALLYYKPSSGWCPFKWV